MVCNADAHAKNYSLLLEVEKVKLSPLCDGLATWYWPQYSKALAMLAMSVNDVWFTNEITLSDWEALARQNGLALIRLLMWLSTLQRVWLRTRNPRLRKSLV